MGAALEIMEEVEGQILEVPPSLIPFWPNFSCQLSTHGCGHAAKDMLQTGSNYDCERLFRGSGFRSHRDSEDPQSIHLNTLIQPKHSHVRFQDPAGVEASDCRARSLPALRSRSLKKATVGTSGPGGSLLVSALVQFSMSADKALENRLLSWSFVTLCCSSQMPL
jgi:hypothetical protein